MPAPRATDRNHADVAVVVEPEDYTAVLTELSQHGGSTTLLLRKKLAAKAYARTASYRSEPCRRGRGGRAGGLHRGADRAVAARRLDDVTASQEARRQGLCPHRELQIGTMPTWPWWSSRRTTPRC